MFVFTSMPLVPSAVRTQGADSNYTHLAGEPTDHAIGRSRSGVMTKVHAVTEGFVRPVSVLLSVGQAGDNPMLEALLETYGGQQNAERGTGVHPSGRQGLFARFNQAQTAREA